MAPEIAILYIPPSFDKNRMPELSYTKAWGKERILLIFEEYEIMMGFRTSYKFNKVLNNNHLSTYILHILT